MEQKKISFQKLTPTDEVVISVYEEAIDFAFENEDVTNIAISGPYSAGKSSVIESYKKAHQEHSFMHISLAHFEDIKDGAEDEQVKEAVLEGKILNQLIHQIPVEKIPQTNFRVKKEATINNIVPLTLLLCSVIGSTMFLLWSNEITTFVSGLSDSWVKSHLSVITSKYAVIIMALVLIFSSIVSIFNIVKIQKNRNLFRKFSIQGNEIEIFESQDESYFDKYLNEVLYLFEQVDVDAIVFEDMDRFNANSIFERLREVNKLTNIQRKNKTKRQKRKNNPLRFFYLLRDDIFITKDRTKFFDYIVPIVPVVDGSNAYDQFAKYLKQGDIFDKFDTSFLQRLSLYIDDMRVLKNIYNEFVVYINRLNNTNLNWDKMMAMIVYKNLFPRDFSNLQLAKGYIHELFRQKENFCKNVIGELENKKKEIEEIVSRINNETLNSVEELEAAYLAKYSRLPRVPYYSDRLTDAAQKEKQKLELEKNKRKQAIEDMQSGKILEHEKNLRDVQYQIAIARSMLLREMITRENADAIFMVDGIDPLGKKQQYENIKSSDYFELLKFLVREGYIDETYTDYMTYFYEESLSAHDKSFLRTITDKRGADYEYSLREVQKVLDSPALRVVDFGEEETLNFALLNGLLSNQEIPKYKEYLSTLLMQIKNDKKIEFVSKYYDTASFDVKFVEKLNEYWPGFFSYVQVNKLFSEKQLRRYSLDILYHSDREQIEAINIDDVLGNYIIEQNDYLNIVSPDIEKIISQFKVLRVSFKSIDFNKSDRELYSRVYENDMYELTFDNIELMLKTQYSISDAYSICHKNYTLVRSNPNSPLARYIDENMQQYIDEILSNCGDSIEDDEEAVLNILNSEKIDMDTKMQYIQILKTVILNVIEVKDVALWKLLLQNNLLYQTASNVVNYYSRHKMDNYVIDYINSLKLDVDFSGIEESFGEEIAENFYDDVVKSNEINSVIYKKILTDIGYFFNTYDVVGVSDEKVKILIDAELLQMCKESLEFIRKQYPDQSLYFIEHNLEEYLHIQSLDIADHDEIVQVLGLEFDVNRKIELLKYTKKPISIRQKEYLVELQAYILEHNLDTDDLDYLFEYYSTFEEGVRDIIYTLSVSEVDNIIMKHMVLDDKLLSELLVKGTHSSTVKIQLWESAIPRLDEGKCKVHFDELGVPELKGIFTKRNTTRTYERNLDVTAILEALKKHTWIYDYYESEDDAERYVVVKKSLENKSMDA